VTASSSRPNPTPSAALPAPDDDADADEASLPPMSRLVALPYAEAKRQLVARFDESYTGELLRSTGGNMSEAARRAGLDRSNFRRLLKRHKDDE
jgi:DNA-binding NtrC family response regulator